MDDQFICPNKRLKPTVFEWSLFKPGINRVPMYVGINGIARLEARLQQGAICVSRAGWDTIVSESQTRLAEYGSATRFIKRLENVIDRYEKQTSVIDSIAKKRMIDTDALAASLSIWKKLIVTFFALGYIDEVIETVAEIYSERLKQILQETSQSGNLFDVNKIYYALLVPPKPTFMYSLTQDIWKLHSLYKADSTSRVFQTFLEEFIERNYLFVFYLCKESLIRDEASAVIRFLQNHSNTFDRKELRPTLAPNDETSSFLSLLSPNDRKIFDRYYNLVRRAQHLRDDHAPRQLRGIYVIKRCLRKALPDSDIEELTIDEMISRLRDGGAKTERV